MNNLFTLQDYLEKQEPISYTWPQLFKEPSEAKKILSLIVENLSSAGEWLTEPKGRYLGALCTELIAKGYLKRDLSAPAIAEAFNNQFNLRLHPKNFQPEQRNKAEDKREYFKHIPSYQPSKT